MEDVLIHNARTVTTYACSGCINGFRSISYTLLLQYRAVWLTGVSEEEQTEICQNRMDYGRGVEIS